MNVTRKKVIKSKSREENKRRLRTRLYNIKDELFMSLSSLKAKNINKRKEVKFNRRNIRYILSHSKVNRVFHTTAQSYSAKPYLLIKPFPIHKISNKRNNKRNVSTQSDIGVNKKQRIYIKMKRISSYNAFDESYIN